MAEFTVYAGSAGGWDSSGNATGAPDEVYAYENDNADGWKYLTLSNFGITDELPVDAVVDSLTVSALLKGKSGITTDRLYGQVYARINGVNQAASSPKLLYPTASVHSKEYTTGAPIDPANLTDALFQARVAVEFKDMSTLKKAECDYVAVTVTYHLPSGGIEMGCVF